LLVLFCLINLIDAQSVDPELSDPSLAKGMNKEVVQVPPKCDHYAIESNLLGVFLVSHA
jgi:hypothetical protein